MKSRNQTQKRHKNFNETSQISQNSQKHQIFVTEKSFIQGIRENDISKIIDIGEQGGNINETKLYDEKAEASFNAVDIRTKYNEVKTQSLNMTANIEKLTGILNFFKEQEAKYKNIAQNQKNAVAEAQKKLKEIKTLVESTLYTRDTYLNIQNNSKADILILKKRYFDIQILVNRDRNKLKNIKIQAFAKRKLGLSCQRMCDNVQQTVSMKVQERQTKINSFYQVLGKKVQNKRRISQRRKEVSDIMLAAMTQKSQQQKQWIKIFNTNIFLKKLLKNKMQRIILKNQQVQKCFQRIKLQTDVTYVQDFVSRFLNRQKNYGRLLQSISQKQLKLNEIKILRQKLEKQNQKLVYQSDQLDQISKKSHIIPIQYEKTLDQLNSKLISIEKLKQAIYSNSIKGIVNILGLNRRDTLYKKYPKLQVKDVFKDYLQYIKDILLSIEKQTANNLKIEQAYLKSGMKEKTMTQDMLSKVMRVKTLQTNDEQFLDDEFDDKDMGNAEMSQKDYLNYERKIVKKNDNRNKNFRVKTKPI